MDEKIRTLHELCEVISRELEDVSQKIRSAGGSMSAGDLELVDKLTHALKSIKTTMAMMESEDEGGYSGHYMMPRYAYNDGRSYARRNSYAGDGYGGMSSAGRRTRDSMGRYSGNYSYADDMSGLLDEMRGMMDSLPEEKRREVQRFVDKMDRM